MVRVWLLPCVAACVPPGLDTWVDDFESYTAKAQVLAEGSDEGWSEQITADGNGWTLVQDRVAGGEQAVRFEAVPTDGATSKASLFVNDMHLEEGTVVSFAASYWLSEDSGRPFLMDLEEDAVIGAGPGMRLWLDEDQALMLERKKYAEKDVYQDGSKVTFPRDQWVVLRMETFLSQGRDGWVEVYQDDELVLNVPDIRTLPRDRLYAIQGTRGAYTNVEVGITAAGVGGAVELWMDDVVVQTLR